MGETADEAEGSSGRWKGDRLPITPTPVVIQIGFTYRLPYKTHHDLPKSKITLSPNRRSDIAL
jgi:hypothetical protein